MQKATDCDMVLVHDNDLVTIGGLGRDSVSGLLNSNHILPLCWQSIETLEPDMMADFLRRSDMEINKVWYGKLSTLI
jgi:hypothetical protein